MNDALQEQRNVQVWQERISAIGSQAISRVGLVWADGVRSNYPDSQLMDAERSLLLRHFESLAPLSIPGGFQFFSLQLGEPAKQLGELQSQSWQGLPIIDFTADLKDWADMAAFIANLDLVISCDTAVAHLAAAMGKPIRILSRWNGDWEGVMAEVVVACYDQLLQSYPQVSSIHFNRGMTLWGMQRVEEAALSYTLAIACDAQNVDAYNERGNALYALGRRDEALRDFERALAINPNHLPARQNRVVILQNAQQHGAVVVDFEYLIQAGHRTAEAYYGLAGAQHRLNQFCAAIASYEKVLQIQPDHPNAFFENLSCQLMVGNYATAWASYERRWEASLHKRDYAKPLWLGDASLQGKTILLWPEQGYGDMLQFSRYALVVAQMGAKVLLATSKPLLRLFKQSFANTGVVVMQDGAMGEAEFDLHCPLMSLPLACGTTSVEKIPADTPYLFADASSAADWQQRLAEQGAKGDLRIGLVWAGGFHLNDRLAHEWDGLRSFELRQCAPLVVVAQTISAQIFSLQLDEPAQQLQALQSQDWQGLPIIDLTADLKDWADTAALIANLDLVISCDTAVAHLAAAMGKPTWILSRFNGCWRWLDGRDDSPWYPTVRLFRQKTRGDWDGVMAEVALALASYNA